MIAFAHITILLVKSTSTTTVSYIVETHKQQCYGKLQFPFECIFHYFNKKNLARGDFILYFVYKARHHVLIDDVNCLYVEYHFTVKTRK